MRSVPRSPHATRSNLRQWRPQTHNYCGQGVHVYDDALLLVEGSHIASGDRVLVGAPHRPTAYRVRHVAYSGGALAYWKVRLERLVEAG